MVTHSSVKHVLVIRLRGLSQTAMCVHALRGLRRDFPELKITVLTVRQFEPLFRGVEGVEYLFADEPCYKGVAGEWRLWRSIQRLGVDAIADLEASGRSSRLAFSLKPRRIAHIDKSRNERRLLTRKFRKVMTQLEPLSQRSREVFNQLGLPFCMPAPIRRRRIVEPPQIATILAGEKRGVWIGVAPLSPNHGTCYPIPQAAELIGLLADKYDKVFVFGNGKYERQFCEGMQTKFESVISIAERASLSEQMELIKMLDAVVTIDGPILSLASLVGTPAVSIWGATHPFIESCGYGQNPANSVQIDLPCRPCSVDGRHQCLLGSHECMRRITPQMVAKRVEEVVKGC
ncbi:MAG: glycosyltransferase family 9 protein [Rikenellaceae bacterium]|nr:glycosyltransferase family 9 protein [Rikenellaceae bacterium]